MFYLSVRFRRMSKLNVFVLLLAYTVHYYKQILCCNEAICSSVVSKCLLLRSCMCLLDDLKCHKDCFDCLGPLSTECCICLGICPELGSEQDDILNKQSLVEDFSETIPGLFRALTEYPDEQKRWTVVTYNQQEKELDVNDLNRCTVIFISDCTSLQGCRKNCHTMGSIACRWFYSGCCECIGNNCWNYGLNQSRCANCPKRNQLLDYDYDYDYDYDDDYKD